MNSKINTITISRCFGSGGRSFAKALSQKLMIPLFNGQLLSELAVEMKTSEEIVNEYEKMKYGTEGFFLSTFSKRYSFLEKDIIESRKYISSLKKVILKLVSLGRIIILGRGSQCILHNHPGCLHLRIVAEKKYRLKRATAREEYSSYSQKQLEQFIKSMDRYRAQFIQKHFGWDIDDPILYHLILNFSMFNPESAVEMVKNLVE